MQRHVEDLLPWLPVLPASLSKGPGLLRVQCRGGNAGLGAGPADATAGSGDVYLEPNIRRGCLPSNSFSVSITISSSNAVHPTPCREKDHHSMK
jgi:hypothetical protein